MKTLASVCLLSVLGAVCLEAASVNLSEGWRQGEVRVQLPFEGQPLGVYRLTRSVERPTAGWPTDPVLLIGAIEGAYRVSVNGVRIGEVEGFGGEHTPAPKPRLHTIPPELLTAKLEIELEIAFLRRTTFFRPPYDRDYYLLADRKDAERARIAQTASILASRIVPGLFLNAAEAALGIFFLLIWRTIRHSDVQARAVLWLGAYCIAVGSYGFLYSWTSLFPAPDAFVFRWLLLFLAVPAIMRYEQIWQLLPDRVPSWRLLLYGGYFVLSGWSYYSGDAWWQAARQNSNNVLSAGLSLMAVLDRRNRVRVPGAIYLGLSFLSRSGVFWIGPMSFAYVPAYRVLAELLLLGWFLHRAKVDRREQERLRAELAAARQVQQFLLPTPAASDGLRVEAAYEPALEVGGDFWQSLPGVSGGHILAVGDVSGKGLQAAMMVSLLTGALRNRRSDNPAEILGELNRVAVSALPGGGFVTAVVAHIEGERMAIANAGHPAPYWNGEELELEAGLPLGIDPEATYGTYTRAFDGELTVVSDGVIEAANAQGELFGFERTRAISGKTAQEIAAAARAWGQNDDITVVTVRRAV